MKPRSIPNASSRILQIGARALAVHDALLHDPRVLSEDVVVHAHDDERVDLVARRHGQDDALGAPVEVLLQHRRASGTARSPRRRCRRRAPPNRRRRGPCAWSSLIARPLRVEGIPLDPDRVLEAAVDGVEAEQVFERLRARRCRRSPRPRRRRGRGRSGRRCGRCGRTPSVRCGSSCGRSFGRMSDRGRPREASRRSRSPCRARRSRRSERRTPRPERDSGSSTCPARRRLHDPQRVGGCLPLAAAEGAGAEPAQVVERQIRLVAVGPGEGELAAGDGDVPRLERLGSRGSSISLVYPSARNPSVLARLGNLGGHGALHPCVRRDRGRPGRPRPRDRPRGPGRKDRPIPGAGHPLPEHGRGDRLAVGLPSARTWRTW